MAKKTTDDPFTRKSQANATQAEQIALFDYTDGQYLEELRMDWIRPWEQNPRKNFDQAGLLELAESIAQDGIQQPIVVRLVGSKPSALGSDIPDFQIVMGERRFLASQMLEKATIRAIVRVELSDKDALRLAVVENLQRRDLNAIEEANSFLAMIAAGYKQQEIATLLGIGQGTVSNAIRLRKLPAAIQHMVVEGRLSASHVRNLLRFEGFPDIQLALAEYAIKNNTPAKELESGVPLSPYLRDKGLIVSLNYAKFDTTICKACPFNAYRDNHHGQFCIKPEHYRELEAEAEKAVLAKKAAMLAEVEAKRAGLREVLRAGENAKKPSASPTEENSPTDATDTDALDTELEETVPPALRSLEGFKYGEYETISSSSPEPCQSSCPCRVECKSRYGNGTEWVCLDPKRFASLKRQATKEQNKSRRTQMQEYGEQTALMETAPDDTRALAVLVWCHLDSLSKPVKAKVFEGMQGLEIVEELTPARYDRHGKEDVLLGKMAELPAQTLMKLALRALLYTEQNAALTNQSEYLPYTKFYFARNNSTPEPLTEEEAEEGNSEA